MYKGVCMCSTLESSESSTKHLGPTLSITYRPLKTVKGPNFMFFLVISVATDNNLELFFRNTMSLHRSMPSKPCLELTCPLSYQPKTDYKVSLRCVKRSTHASVWGWDSYLGMLIMVWAKENDHLSISTKYYFCTVIEGHCGAQK